MAVKLSARMKALADLVTPGAHLADVGTDHGYIPVFLCQTGKIQNAIAMDINRGPLQRAEAHVAEYGLEGEIMLRLSDGLDALAPGEADTILVAGMGGALIKRILGEGEAVLVANPELILQPQSEIPSVRAYLREIGYAIVDEDCVLEDGKFYFMMKARRENGTDSEFGNRILADAFGPVLLKNRHPVLRLYLERELTVVRDIREKLSGQLFKDDMPSDLHTRQENPFAECPQRKTEGEADEKREGLADGPAHVGNKFPSKREKLKMRLREVEDRQCLLERAMRLYEA